uniref:Immunoglobulin like and fibronectin type III domain containing 1, tandem duplicate 2 n=1 Tax=Cynoglossus semilaevis TaxID=244447 RepID=A0A3P8WIH2_CYNSE
AAGQLKMSRVSGVTVIQSVELVPLGKSTPDFTRKPMALNVQEGKKALFKAMVSGAPPPVVTWERTRGEMNDPNMYKTRYDARGREHILEIPSVKHEHADTYKCFATNDYGTASCNITLNVIEGKTHVVPTRKKQLPPKKEGEIDPKLWELLLSARKRDYEKICLDFGVTDFRWLLKRLNQMKKEREDEQAKLENVKQIQIKPNGRAEFSMDMKLWDANSSIHLYKDGKLVPYSDDANSKYCLKKSGTRYTFSIKDPQPEDAGFYQVDVDDTNVLTTDFQDAKAVESEDAVFTCHLSKPLNGITWLKGDMSLDDVDKYEITVSEDKLVHTLTIKDCNEADKGKYYAIAGLTASSASLVKSTVFFICFLIVADRGVQFVSGLSDTTAKLGERAELSCKISSETTKGRWYKNGKLLTNEDGVRIIKEGACHRLIIDCCQNDDTAVYRFEAEGRKSEATLNIQDPPKIDQDALGEFTKPVTVKAGETAEWKLPFSGGVPMNVQWHKDDDELVPAFNVKIETSANESQLRLTKCQRKDSGDVKIKMKNEFGTMEAISKLIVVDKPSPPLGPVDIVESAVTSVEFKWKPPKDNGGCPVTNYIIERQQVGRNKWTSLGEIPGKNLSYKDSDVDPGRKYCYRIKAKNAEGVSDYLKTEDIAAGYPGSPTAPKVQSAFKDCINLTWGSPCDTGGTKIVGYNLEKHKKGTNYWSLVNQGGPITVKDIFEGAAYEFRVSAINLSGAGDPSIPCDTVIARDPMKAPGKITGLKLTSSDYTTLSLAWNKPKALKGTEDEAQGYYVEIRPMESPDWTRCNSMPISLTSYTVLGLKAMTSYWVRVIATNYGGDGEPQAFDNYLIAMPPPVRPKFKDRNMTTFVVVRSGNTVRLNFNFEASPHPDVSWLKDGSPVGKHVTITNSDKGSQMLIPTSERSDTGIYTITLKNLVGLENFNVEVRVTDDPKPPGPVELDQIIPGTVTLSWSSSPDEKRDDRLHYMISKKDSSKGTWRTVADNLYNNKFTVINILPGREYNFRVYAKNDMGLSEPSESPRETKSRNLESPPSFLVPLKRRTAPEGYECCMSCAVRGNPAPRVTWYRDNVSLNTNTNYYITNTCGVCSLLILRTVAKDNGEYKVVIQNKLGISECSMILNPKTITLFTYPA